MGSGGGGRVPWVFFRGLAHRGLYVQEDNDFNGLFASLVDHGGSRQWRAYRGLPPDNGDRVQQQDQFTQLVLNTRSRLEQLYTLPLPPEQMRQRKAAAFERMRGEYRQLRDSQWAGDKRHDAWINPPVHNDRLLPLGLYDQWVPAFAGVVKPTGGDGVGFDTGRQQPG